jgi:hypothetical protein
MVFYYLHSRLNKKTLELPKLVVRQGQYIKIICNELGVTHADLGIVEADRAQVYFKGRWNDSGMDNYLH